MTDSTMTAAAANPAMPRNVAELAQALPGIRQGARWFWWIAGLTAVNVGCELAHADINFVLGLAFTQLGHAWFADSQGTALAIDALCLGFFFLVGQQAQRGAAWAFVLGMAVYLVDGLVYLKFQDWLPVAFHAYALYSIGRAFMALQAAKKALNLR